MMCDLVDTTGADDWFSFFSVLENQSYVMFYKAKTNLEKSQLCGAMLYAGMVQCFQAITSKSSVLSTFLTFMIQLQRGILLGRGQYNYQQVKGVCHEIFDLHFLS